MNEINIDFLKDNNGIIGVQLDIIDFLTLCHAGKEKNPAMFKEIIKLVDEVNEEFQREKE